jgi:hypothetical protein
MALVVKDRVKETTTTSGLGSYGLAGASVGFQSFSAVGDGNTTYYTVTDGVNWEVGIGTYTAAGPSLSRDSILESSNAGNAVSWGTGKKDVFVTYPAERSVTGNASALAIPDPGANGNVLTSDGTSWTSAPAAGGGVSSVTASAPLASSGGANPDISLTGIVAVANGGTGQSTQQAALNALAGATTSAQFLRGDGTNVTMSAIQASDVPTLNQNTTGTAGNVTGVVAIVNGGTGQTTANAALNALLPSQSGNSGKFLTTDGADTSWATAGGGSATLTIQNKTSAYTVVAGDLGTIINCTSGTFTVALDAAATLGSGFNCWIWNTGTGVITIDPNGAETIDGVSTLILRPGEGTQIVCNGTNWETGDKKTMRGYAENFGSTFVRPVASVNPSVAIGANSANQGSQSVSGPGAIALGGSYASGTDSFAAAIAKNTSSYGAKSTNTVAMGYNAVVSQSYSASIGYTSKATGQYAIALGAFASATADGAVAVGNSYWLGAPTASGQSSVAIGDGVTASQRHAVAIGAGAVASIIGKFSNSSGYFAAAGDSQQSFIVLRTTTSTATPNSLVSNASPASTINQVILPNNSAYVFTGTVVARQKASGGTASAAWKVEGLIRREGTAGTTTLVASTVTAISNVPGWTLALSADTTNGGLSVKVTGAVLDIRWVATIQASEVTYA